MAGILIKYDSGAHLIPDIVTRFMAEPELVGIKIFLGGDGLARFSEDLRVILRINELTLGFTLDFLRQIAQKSLTRRAHVGNEPIQGKGHNHIGNVLGQ